MLVSSAGLWGLGRQIDDPYRHSQLALLAATLAITSIAPGLAGADLDLDRVAGFAWAPRRAAHLLLGGALTVGLLALAVRDEATVSWIARDVAGLTGLIGIGAAALGASRGPLLCLLWTAAAIALPAVDRPAYRVILTWMMQPAGTTTATVAAVVLAVGGVLTYALAGPRR